MSAERMAALVAAWARLYTRGVPAPVARRRIEELDADLHDHMAHERAAGTAEWRLVLALASRMLRGLPADAAWRRRAINAKEAKMSPVRRSATRIAVVTVAVLLVPLAAMPFDDGPGWSLFDFVLAAVLLVGSGALLELAARRPRAIALRVAAVVLGVAAIVLGEADDAPGLVLFGLLLILGTVALSARMAQRRA